jgi:acyl carrier protein
VNENTTESIRAIVADVLILDIDEVGSEGSMDSLPDWDSMATVQIVMKIETTFGVRLHYKDISDIKTIADLVRLSESS